MSKPIIKGYCSWHKGWFDRATGEPIECADKAETHGVCPKCSAQEVEKYRARPRYETSCYAGGHKSSRANAFNGQ
jgi:nitrite reductase/ring-hydroxylating ferredoxin subunit